MVVQTTLTVANCDALPVKTEVYKGMVHTHSFAGCLKNVIQNSISKNNLYIDCSYQLFCVDVNVVPSMESVL